MNAPNWTKAMTAGLAAMLMAACATAPERPDGADAARGRLTELQADSQLASRAPVAVNEAELAVRAAEQPHEDEELAEHLIFMADRKVAIAWARAEQRLAEDQREMLTEQRDSARLESRTTEANRARRDANLARDDAEAARGDAEAARGDAEAARGEVEVAQKAARKSGQDAQELRDQITELNARATERGLLVTLGDVLFDTGEADLKVAQSGNLEKLASFLNRYEDRDVVIEGHTDDVGSVDANYGLSQRRADAVKTYLVGHGISAARLTASGKGEVSPVADNGTAFGRQQNRRVEVIISNAATSLR